MQILACICEGMGNREISEALDIRQATVKQHLMNAYNKVGARSRAELIIIVLRAGLVVPSWMPVSPARQALASEGVPRASSHLPGAGGCESG
jgi:DNA-binding CsgD family transcriptional regulator